MIFGVSINVTSILPLSAPRSSADWLHKYVNLAHCLAIATPPLHPLLRSKYVQQLWITGRECSAAPDWERGTLRNYINGIGRFIISFNNIIVIRLNVLAYTSNEWQVQQTGWDEQRFQVRNPSRPPSRIYWRDDSGEGVIFEVGGLAIMVWAWYRRLEINVSKNCGAGSKWEGVLGLLIQPSYAENTCHKERIFRMYQVYKPCWLPLRILYYFTFIYVFDVLMIPLCRSSIVAAQQ